MTFFAAVSQCFHNHTSKLIRIRDALGDCDRRIVFLLLTAMNLWVYRFLARGAYNFFFLSVLASQQSTVV